jgi:hypothetical protein
MAFTRTKYDDCRIVKQLQQSTDPSRWTMNVPGNNIQFIEDPYIRIQKWGANMSANPVSLESELTGRNTTLSRGDIKSSSNPQYTPKTYPSNSSCITDQSRATNPAFLYRDLTTHIPVLFNRPIQFSSRDEIDTRLLAKNNYNNQ